MSPKQFREMFERVVAETEHELQRATLNQVADIPDFGFAECWSRFCKWNQEIERELAEEREARSDVELVAAINNWEGERG